MAIHVIERSQVVPASRDDCWSFFSNPRNLAAITPKDLDFRVLSDLPDKMYAGLMIRYRVRPLLGVPITWLTEITRVDAPGYFVDEQRVGPYRIWHHEHFFEELPEGGTLVRDLVHYVLPLGPFGDVINRPVVQPQLKKIFAFREEAVARLFPMK